MSNNQIVNELLNLVLELRQLGASCNDVAEKHRRKGEIADADRQGAFGYARNSSAQMLENKVKELYPEEFLDKQQDS